MPNWVGDVVMATAALRAIRRALPAARISVALKGYVAPVLSGNPFVDDLVVLGEGEERGPLGWVRVSRRLRATQYDAAILLTNSLTSLIPVFLARIPRRIGYVGDGRSLLLTDRVFPEVEAGRRVPVPMPLYYQRLLDAVGIESAGPEYEVPPTDEDREVAAGHLTALGRDPGRPLVGLNPGARFGSSKLWDPVRFGELARRLIRRGCQPLLLCGPGESDMAAPIQEAAGEGLLDTSRDPIGLGPLRAIMHALDLLVTTDSGPRHLAVAAGCRVVVIMGSTWPQWTAWNLERTRVVRHDVPCGPCHLRTCPTDHACMDLVTVDEVEASVDDLLADWSPESA